MSKSIKRNYIYNLLYEIVTLLVPLITTPYVSRVLGAEGIGTYSYSYSIVAYFAYFAALGTTVYGRREIAYNQENREKRSLVFWELFLLRLVTTGTCLVLYIIYVFSVSPTYVSVVQGLYIVAVIFDITWVYQGIENFGAVVFRNTLVKLCGIVFIFTAVKEPSDLILYIAGIALFPILGSIFLWTNLKKYIDFPKGGILHPFKHIKGAFLLFIPTIASQVYLLLDKTMIGIFTTTSIENGYYEQAQKIIRMCITLLTTFGTVMSPRIAYIYGQKNIKLLREYMQNSFRFIWFLAIPITFGIIGITGNLVPWFFGDGFLPVKQLLYIFSLIIIPEGLCAITGSQYLVATKRQKWFTISIVAAAAINFIINIILIPHFYSVGAAIASVIAEYVICIIQITYIVRYTKEIEINDIFGGMWKYFTSGILMLLIIFPLGEFLLPNMFSTLLVIAIGFMVYFLLLILFKDKFVSIGIKRIMSMIHSIKKG